MHENIAVQYVNVLGNLILKKRLKIFSVWCLRCYNVLFDVKITLKKHYSSMFQQNTCTKTGTELNGSKEEETEYRRDNFGWKTYQTLKISALVIFI